MAKDLGTLKLTCPRCGVATQATVSVSFTWPELKSPKKPSESYMVVCSGCEEPFFVEYYEDREKLFSNLSVEGVVRGKISELSSWQKLYPMEFISNVPEHIPDDVAPFYIEACGCLANGHANAAGAMFRKTLEAATRTNEVVAKLPTEALDRFQSSWLAARLKILKENGVIPEPLFDLADTLKAEGDEAVHGMVTYTIEEATELKAFAEAFLTYIFTMPFKMRAVRTAKEQRSGK
jgi:Domain of unknown function (DUF4145)